MNKTLIYNKKSNHFYSILSYLPYLLLFIGTLIILFTLPYTLTNLSIDNKIDYINFLNMDSFVTKHYNWVLIYRFVLLSFVFYYTIIKTINAIRIEREIFDKYVYLFFSYIALGLTALCLLIFYVPKADQVISSTWKMYYLSFILIPLLVIEIVNCVFMYMTKRKTEPLVYGQKYIYIVSISFKFIVVFTWLFFAYFFIYMSKFNNKTNQAHTIFENPMYVWFYNLLHVKNVLNFFVLSILFIVVFALISLSFFDNIIIYYIKLEYKRYAKKHIYALLSISLSILIWFIYIMTLNSDKNTAILATKNNTKWIYWFIANTIIVSGALSLFIYFSFSNKMGNKSILLKTIMMFGTQLIIYLFLLLNALANKNTLSAKINLFITIAASIAVLIIFSIKTKHNNFGYSALLYIFTLLLIILFSFYGLNELLLNYHSPANTIINRTIFPFTTSQILILTIITMSTLALLSLSLIAIIYIAKISKIRREQAC